MKVKNKNQDKTVSVIGIGRVGLPLALVLANKGFSVIGIGRNQEKIDSINKGKMPFIEKGANKILKEVVGKNFIATTDYSFVKNSDYIILTLGTPIDENMNAVFTQIEDAIASSKKYLHPGQTLILRSTVSPGTTKYVASLLNDVSSISVGKNFFIAYCPERISEGKAIEEMESIPQIIGGLDKKNSAKADELFKSIGVKTLISDDVSAELAKLFTNMYRYINFAISNEFMVLAGNYKRDIYEILNLVNYEYPRGGIKPPGFSAGPCLFKDGFFLVQDLPYADLISVSWKVNESIPGFLIKKITETMSLENKKAVLLGLAFKADIDDERESLSFKVRKALFQQRAKVVIHDPFIKNYRYQKVEEDVYSAIEGAELIFIATNHTVYKKLNIKKVKKLAKKNCVICDVWNVFKTDKIIFKLSEV